MVIKIYPNTYHDSVQLMFITSKIKKMHGVQTALVAMGTQANKEIFIDIGADVRLIESAGPNDLIVGVKATDNRACKKAMEEVHTLFLAHGDAEDARTAYKTIAAAKQADEKANLCVISVPAEYVKAEAIQALNMGLHLLIFSDNVPLEDEHEIKQLARDKGLLCMGPDCGVANINGISFLVGSIVRKGPIGICGASGVGLQEIAALIHRAGSGISQGIGTGGKDLKDQVGGLTMLSGIEALEQDQETEAIVLVSRLPENATFEKIMTRVSDCRKPVIICFLGCERQTVEQYGVVYARSLEDAAAKALACIGITQEGEDKQRGKALAEKEAMAMISEQKFVRGLFCGGTFCDEAMIAMSGEIGDIYSNASPSARLKLPDANVSYKNTVVDYGAEEFTKGRPHPVIDTYPRGMGILREAQDPETAVILLDFILGPAVNSDPVGSVIDNIKEAMKTAADRGGKLAVVASVCGTEADPQKRSEQVKLLRNAGVIVCPNNYQAAVMAAEIIKSKRGRDNF